MALQELCGKNPTKVLSTDLSTIQKLNNSLIFCGEYAGKDKPST